MSPRAAAAATLAALLAAAAAPTAPAAAQDVSRDVPYVPTPPAVVQAMLRVAGVGPDDVVYDLGSGDGRIVIAAARDFGVRRGVGVDIDPEMVAEARENARRAGVADRVEFHQRDLFETDLREATVVTLYLLPMINVRLRPKLLDELAPGSRVVSHAFDMDEWAPDRELEVDERRILFWTVPARVMGSWRWTPPGAAEPVEVVLDQRFQELFGAVQAPGGTAPSFEEGRVVGTRVGFTLVEHHPGETRRARYEGVVEGDEIRGTVEMEGGAYRGAHEWRARQVRPEPRLR